MSSDPVSSWYLSPGIRPGRVHTWPRFASEVAAPQTPPLDTVSLISKPAPLTPSEAHWVNRLEEKTLKLLQPFMREIYLFSSARLRASFNPFRVLLKHPGIIWQTLMLPGTVKKLQALSQKYPGDERIKRLQSNAFSLYMMRKNVFRSIKIQNTMARLQVDVADLKLKDAQGKELKSIPFKDIQNWMQKHPDKAVRHAVDERVTAMVTRHLRPLAVKAFDEDVAFLNKTVGADLIAFYSKDTGHPLPHLVDSAKSLLVQTRSLYQSAMIPRYKAQTGEDFALAEASDAGFVLQPAQADQIRWQPYFAPGRLLPVLNATLEGMGIPFSKIAKEVDFKTIGAFEASLRGLGSADAPKIMIDAAPRPGKESRAFVMPVAPPFEIYLSLKPNGLPDDYMVALHESGHANHFAHANPALGFAMNMLGNKAATETYAYLFQGLMQNRHWLKNQVGLPAADAAALVREMTLRELYMLRRYAGKIQYEVGLFQTPSGGGKPALNPAAESRYAELLTQATGFRYRPEKAGLDMDAGFYVADYFTAWTLEAQLSQYLAKTFGTPEHQGEDWYQNPKAGQFLVSLWQQGNISPHQLVKAMGGSDPYQPDALLARLRKHMATPG